MKATFLFSIAFAALAASSPVASTAVGEPLYYEGDVAHNATVEARAAAKNNYQRQILNTHNNYRKKHSAGALTWNAQLAESAKNLVKECKFEHSKPGPAKDYGQNLAGGTYISRSNVDDAVIMWYNEEPNYRNEYGKATPDMSKFGSFGHFTQVVWKGSKQVGCATLDCSKKGFGAKYMTACNYYPSGNYLGQFGANVGRPT